MILWRKIQLTMSNLKHYISEIDILVLTTNSTT